MSIKKGFTIIELLVYILITILIISVVFHFIITVNQNVSLVRLQLDSISKINVIQDALERDISIAPIQLRKWKIIKPSILSWQKNNEIISWFIENNMIIRTKTEFNSIKQKWSKKKKSVVGSNIVNIKFFLKYKKHLIKGYEKVVKSVTCSIEYQIKNKIKSIERTFFMKNRIFL